MRQFGSQTGPHVAKPRLRLNNVGSDPAEYLIKGSDNLDDADRFGGARNAQSELVDGTAGCLYRSADCGGGRHQGHHLKTEALPIKFLGKAQWSLFRSGIPIKTNIDKQYLYSFYKNSTGYPLSLLRKGIRTWDEITQMKDAH